MRRVAAATMPFRVTGMNPMTKIVVGVAVIALLVVGGFFVWDVFFKTEAPSPVTEPPPPVVEGPSTYASSTLGFTLQHPKRYTVNEAYAYDQFGPQKLINGVKFTIPIEMATGTNLSSDSGISVEWLPRAKKCTGDIYLLADVKPTKVVDMGVDYSVATSSGAAAGNMYEEIVFAVASSSPCTAVRYFVHSTNIGNYATGTVREFDRATLFNDFDIIRRSLRFK